MVPSYCRLLEHCGCDWQVDCRFPNVYANILLYDTLYMYDISYIYLYIIAGTNIIYENYEEWRTLKLSNQNKSHAVQLFGLFAAEAMIFANRGDGGWFSLIPSCRHFQSFLVFFWKRNGYCGYWWMLYESKVFNNSCFTALHSVLPTGWRVRNALQAEPF